MSDTGTPETDPRDLQIAELSQRLAELTNENQQLRAENKELKKRIERLEALLASKVDAKSSKTPIFTENYSLDRNKLGVQNSDKKPARKSTGRKPRAAKAHLVSDTIAVFPTDVDRGQCVPSVSSPRGDLSMAKPSICATTFVTCPIPPACRCRRESATVAANSEWKLF